MANRHVLFVDDNVFCNIETCNILRDSGFNITTAYCAEAAFEVIRKHEQLTALITDIELGAGPDGFEVARRFRLAYPKLPVVFISGTAARRHAAEGVEGSQFVCKPFDPRQIVTALDRGIYDEAA